VKKMEKGFLPILYTDKTPYTNRAGVEVPKGMITGDVYALPRNVIMAFFQDIISMLLDEDNIDLIVRDSWSSKLPLHQTAMEFQRDVMVSPFYGIFFTVYFCYDLFLLRFIVYCVFDFCFVTFTVIVVYGFQLRLLMLHLLYCVRFYLFILRSFFF
jgi:hypothetical protein